MTRSCTSKFYHGGHLGDMLYALYSIKKYGGGHLIIGPHHHTNWTPSLMRAAEPLCWYQDYIKSVKVVDEKPLDLTYDFTNSWGEQDVRKHFEYDGKSIASCSLKKRDFLNLFKDTYTLPELLAAFDHQEPWLDAHDEYDGFDIVCHLPEHKLVRDKDEWRKIFDYFAVDHDIAMVGAGDVDHWGVSKDYDIIKTPNLLDTASIIKGSRLFIGVASCNYVIAEGLGKMRFVESRDASGVDPMNETGYQIADWSTDRVIQAIKLVLGNEFTADT